MLLCLMWEIFLYAKFWKIQTNIFSNGYKLCIWHFILRPIWSEFLNMVEVRAQLHFLIMNNHLFRRLAMPFWSHSKPSHLCRSFLGSLFHWANERFLHPHCSIWITMCYSLCPGTWKKWSFPELLEKVLVFVAPYSSTDIFESSNYVSWKKKKTYWGFYWNYTEFIDEAGRNELTSL